MQSCAQVIPYQKGANPEIQEADISLYLMLRFYSKLWM